MDTSVVVAFPESPALRETLAVLLEHDCQLRFLRADAAASTECAAASTALVALQRPEAVIRDLRQHWPALPIVAVDVVPPASAASEPPERSGGGLCRVPLEPHAIRTTVLQGLAPDRDTSLRSTARVIAETLHADLSYSLTALRSFSTLTAANQRPDTYALLGAVLREQSYVLGEAIDQLEHFRGRPRAVAVSHEFCTLLCRQLQQPDRFTHERGMPCECTVEAACATAGPLELAPAVAGFVRAHLRRRAHTAVVRVTLTSQGVVLRYPRRRTGTLRSWPLVLAALALQPWAWHVGTSVEADQEVVRLRPAA